MTTDTTKTTIETPEVSFALRCHYTKHEAAKAIGCHFQKQGLHVDSIEYDGADRLYWVNCSWWDGSHEHFFGMVACACKQRDGSYKVIEK